MVSQICTIATSEKSIQQCTHYLQSKQEKKYHKPKQVQYIKPGTVLYVCHDL